jgi:hypothetical protein
MWMYYSLIGLIGPIKSNPHFLNGYLGKMVTNFAKFCVNMLRALW